MTAALERYISTVLKMPAKAEFITRLNNLSGLSGTPMSPLLTNWVRQNFGLSSVAAIQNWSSGKFSPEMLLRWTSVFPSSFENGAIRADLYEILTGGGVIPPVANFSGSPTSINIGDTVAFTDLSTNTPTSWSWAFAGGTPATSVTQNPSVVYNTAGTYNVDLTATNSAGSDLESKPNYITVTNPYLLDNYSGAGAAYSVRKLSSSYTGAALRVRRSSDNGEQDIGFIGLNLDTTALTSFVGAGNGFVTKWYDQTGNLRHMAEVNGSQQPSIVSSGNVITRNGIISLFFNSSSSNKITSNYGLTNGPISTIGVLSLSGTNGNAFIQNNFFGIGVLADNFWGYLSGASVSAVITTVPSMVQYTTGSFALTNNASYLVYGNWNGNSNVVKSRRNGIAAANSGVSGSTIRKNDTGPQSYLIGYASEFIIYPSDQASNVAGMETNINGYYNIYP